MARSDPNRSRAARIATLTGRAVDENGEGVASAMITVWPGPVRATTRADGTFELVDVVGRSVGLAARSDRHFAIERELRLASDPASIVIRMALGVPVEARDGVITRRP